MRQLAGLDASFLYLETPTTFGHVNGLAIYTRPSHDFAPFEAVRRKFGSMIGRAEPLRRRLVEVPFGLDHPYWIDDPDFDLDYHIRHLGLAPPGSDDQLTEQVARIIGRPMDRTRPLWEVYVIEGLADGRWAMLTKLHHATIDGAAGMLLLNMLTEAEPDSPEYPDPVPWEPEPIPSPIELLQRTFTSLAANPVKAMRLQLRLGQALADMVGASGVGQAAAQLRRSVRRVGRSESARPDNERRVRLPLSPAPPTPWNRTITAHRRFAMRSTWISNIKLLKDATGGTVNDVVMAVCSGALRRYLIDKDALPNRELRAMVPVSIRTGDEDDPWSTRVSAIVAELPTLADDPLERVRLCQVAMEDAKRQFELIPADTISEGTQATSPVIATAALRLASRLRLADRINLPTNVVVSNVPGPRQPRYFAGARLDQYIPISIVTDGMGLNITVHSCLDRLDFGLVAARDLVPDLWTLADYHIEEIDMLLRSAGVDVPEPRHPPHSRLGR
jgi:WS/DGAT/MGAT family acyltransferase